MSDSPSERHWSDIGIFNQLSWSKRLLVLMLAIMVFLMMLLTFVDVVGRYIFTAPIPGVFELIEFLMALVIFTGLPLVSGERGHITVTLLDTMFRGRLHWVKELFVLVFSTAVVGFICLRLWDQANALGEDESATQFLGAPIAPIVYFACGMTAITFVILLIQFCAHLKKVSKS